MAMLREGAGRSLNSQTCYLAMSSLILQIIRRGSLEEKYLVVTKYRQGHACENSWIIIALVAWEGVNLDKANSLYDILSYKLSNFGNATYRQ